MNIVLRHGFPVAPRGLPVVGHLPWMMIWPTRFSNYIRGSLDCDAFWSHLGFDQWQLSVSGNAALEALRNVSTDSSLNAKLAPEVLAHTMLICDGPHHRALRSISQPAFKPKGLSKSNIAATLVELSLDRLQTLSGPGSWPIFREARTLSLSVILRLLGIEVEDLDSWRRHYERYLLLALPIPGTWPGMPRRRGLQARAWIDDRLRQIIADRRQCPREDWVSALIEGRDERGERLSDAEVLANLRLVILAGYETTAVSMTWASLRMAHHPSAWATLRDEAMATDWTSYDATQPGLPFTEAFYRECLRLHPPVRSVSRRAHTGFEIAGRAVPEGTHLSVSLRALGLDPRRFSRPTQFMPERWLRGDRKPSPAEMLQFGGGPHFCLGYHLALAESVTMLALLARRLGELGLRPQHLPKLPHSWSLPVMRPSYSTRLQLERS